MVGVIPFFSFMDEDYFAASKPKKHRSVYGWGINDVNHACFHKGKTWTPYVIWREMIGRCYSHRIKQKYPTYAECSACEGWRYFSNFLRWFEDPANGYRENYHLDKDILVKGNKVYSPDTCCFVPKEINKIFTKSQRARGPYPIGVTKNWSHYQAVLLQYNKHLYLGTFNTPEEAFAAYKTAKEAYIKEVATAYYNEGKITEKVYNALMNYQVEITD